MKVSHELAHYLIDQLSPTGRFSARAIFGCTALFLDGLMVLLIGSLMICPMLPILS